MRLVSDWEDDPCADEDRRLREAVEFIRKRVDHTSECLQRIVAQTAKKGSHPMSAPRSGWRIEECICGLYKYKQD